MKQGTPRYTLRHALTRLAGILGERARGTPNVDNRLAFEFAALASLAIEFPVTITDGVAIVTAPPRLTSKNRDNFRLAIDLLLFDVQKPRTIIVDMGSCKAVDSTSLAMLASVSQRIRDRYKRQIVLRNPSQRLAQLISATSLHDIVELLAA